VSSDPRTAFALDASAVLAVMLNEPGHEQVRAISDRAYIHSVNVAEFVGKLVREGVPRVEAEQMIGELSLGIEQELSIGQAALCGELMAKTRRQGLSLGDCVSLAVAAWVGATAVTADRQWKDLDGLRIDNREIRVQVIR